MAGRFPFAVCYTRGMLRFFLILVGVWAGGLAWAQGLRVRLSPEELFVGDAFRLEVSAEGASLKSVDFAFSGPTRRLGQTQSFMSVNGRTSSTLGWRILAEQEGTLRLERLSATTADGRRLTYDGHPEVRVRALVADPALSLSLTAEPEDPMPGDDVTLTLTLVTPALKVGGELSSPFFDVDFFGRPRARMPRLSFDPTTDEESPLRVAGQAQAAQPEVDGTNLVWRVRYPFRAVRGGEQTFPAPTLRDVRVTALGANGQGESVRCAAIGKPLTVTVSEPPIEGRPEGYVGAIGKTFAAEAALDALNVKVGDPVRLTVTFATDCDPSLLRAPRLPELPGFRAYGEPTRRTLSDGCAFEYSLRPVRDGLLEIPPLTFAWFDRAARQYRTAQSAPVPLRARPTAQLALMGPDGAALSVPPPALVHDAATLPGRGRPRWPWAVLVFGASAFVATVALRLLRRVGRLLAAPFRARRPLARALALLAKTEDPAEAAAAVRLWAGRPALTPAELRALLPASPEADEAVAAYAALEGAAYSGGGDRPEARAALRRLLPTLKTLALVALLFAPLSLPAADAFVREQAWAASVAAAEPKDYAAAANLWIRLAREGECGRDVLLNGATCALLAGRPEASLTLLAHYERRFGRDAVSDQAVRAVCARLGRDVPGPWARVGFPTAAEWCAALLGLFLIVSLVPRVGRWRWLALILFLAAFAWAGSLWLWCRDAPLPEAVTPAEEALP